MPETFAPSNRNVLLGRGAFYINPHDADGNLTRYLHAGYVTEGVLRPSTQDVELRDPTTPGGGVVASDVLSTDWDLSLSLKDMNRENLSLLSAGDQRYFTQSAATVTAEELTDSVELGGYYTTVNRNISTVVLKQGASTLVLDTDYSIVDASAGLIRILPTSETVTAGSTITADYSAAAIASTAQKITDGGTRGSIDCTVLFVSDNKRGPAREYRMWNVNFRPGDLALIQQTDYATGTLAGKLQDDSAGDFGGSADSPYFRVFER